MRAQDRHTVGPGWAVPTASSSSGTTSVGRRTAEVSCRAERRERDGPPGRLRVVLELDGVRAELLGSTEISRHGRRASHAASRRSTPTVAPPSGTAGHAVGGRGRVGPNVPRRPLAGIEGEPGSRQAEPWIARDKWAAARRASGHRGAAAGLEPGIPRRRDQVGRGGFVQAASRWATRGRNVTGRGRPDAGPSMQLGDVLVRARGSRARAAQDLTEDVVVAEPFATLVERDEEEIRALDVAEQPLRARRRRAPHRTTEAQNRRARRCRPGSLRACGSCAERTSSPR